MEETMPESEDLRSEESASRSSAQSEDLRSETSASLCSAQSVYDDGRRNVQDQEGNRWYVTTTKEHDPIAGPFGSHDYALTVRDRVHGMWPGTAYVVPIEEDQNS